MEIADEWSVGVGEIPQHLQQRINALYLECRRTVQEAEELL